MKIDTSKPMSEYVLNDIVNRIKHFRKYTGNDIITMIVVAQQEYLDEMKKQLNQEPQP